MDNLKQVNATAGKTTFVIHIHSCPRTYYTEEGVAKTKAYIAFNGEDAHVTSAGNLKNTASTSGSNASNVAVQILNNNDEPINLTKGSNTESSTSLQLDTLVANSQFNFSAQYIAEDEAATSGNFSGSIPFKIEYK